MRTRIALFTMLMLVCGAVSAAADTIKLKNGSVVKGKVISFSGGSFTVALDFGTGQSRAIIDVRDIDTIEFDGRTTTDEPRANEPRTSSSSVPLPRPSSPDDDRGHRPSTVTTRPASDTPPPATRPAGNIREVVTSVAAKEDWTYASLIVRRGDRIQVSASGRVKISATRESGPEGVEIEDKNKLIADRPTGALIAVIGDDNDDFIFVGREGEFVAQRDGKLFLSVNEGDLTDNNGVFNVRVKLEPAR